MTTQRQKSLETLLCLSIKGRIMLRVNAMTIHEISDDDDDEMRYVPICISNMMI